jgi:signal transduction histidine kinase
MAGKKEVYVNIDWTDFEKVKYIDQVPITITERAPQVFTGAKTGTLLRIHKLRPAQWSDKILREIYRSVNAISSPFETPDAFRVVLKTDTPNVFLGIPTIDEIRKAALYRFRCEMRGDEITSFFYEFNPYRSMDKLDQRLLAHNVKGIKDNFQHFGEIQKMVEKQMRDANTGVKETPSIDLDANELRIGRIVFEGLIFDRQTKVLRLAHVDSRSLRTYLDQNGGVRVYRDGIRVYDYGEPENDWLGLEQSRLYDPGVRINKGLILAAVHLDREASTDLIEKTNREGFVDNAAYSTFRNAVTYAIKIIESCRNEDKDSVRTYYGLSPKSEPVLANLAELKDLVESKVQDEKLQSECIRYIDKIEKDYEQINEILLTSAEAGLNLAVAVHEIEKITVALEKAVRAEKSSDNVIKLIRHLSELIEMYGTLIRKSRDKTEDIKTLINDALHFVQFRLVDHRIEVIAKYASFQGATELHCSSRLVIGSIINIIDNSIYWLHRANVSDKKLWIAIKSHPAKHIQVLIADNGKGFALPPEQMIKPFVSLKPGGIGLGLHIASEVASSQGGWIEFPKFTECELPEEFREGAIVAMVFKKGG